MATFNTVGFEDVEKQLLRRSERAEKAVPRMLKAGAKVLVDIQKSEINSTFHSKRSTGALAESIKDTAVKGGQHEKHVYVYPQGKDEKGVKNATKGFVHQYGRKNMPARPWMTAANAKAEKPVHDAMMQEWEDTQSG